MQLPRLWAGRSALAWCLWPVSIVYGVLFWLRKQLYALGIFKSERVAASVIVVGNVVAGGAGKTPLTLALVQHLKAQNVHVGIVSRGYGRASMQLQSVTPNSTPADVGDEPLFIFQQCQVPGVVGSNRVAAAQHLLSLHPEVSVILCDDGLQHTALQRDMEICVMDERGIGNGWLLPAGPLREPWPRAVDLLLHTGPRSMAQGYAARRSLSHFALKSDGSSVPLAQLEGQEVQAVAAIARSQAFFAMLAQAGLTLKTCTERPDHDALENWQPPHPGLPLLCTEKDAVKLWAHYPEALAVPLIFEPEEAFWKAFDALFQTRHRYH